MVFLNTGISLKIISLSEYLKTRKAEKQTGNFLYRIGLWIDILNDKIAQPLTSQVQRPKRSASVPHFGIPSGKSFFNPSTDFFISVAEMLLLLISSDSISFEKFNFFFKKIFKILVLLIAFLNHKSLWRPNIVKKSRPFINC